MNSNGNNLAMARGAPMTALQVGRLTRSAFVGGAPGLQLVVSAKGARSWRFYYHLPGSTCRRAMSLGRFPSVSLAEARKRAGEALACAADGVDPKAARVKRAARSIVTVDAALDAYLRSALQDNAPRTAEAKAGAFKNHVRPLLGSQSLMAITRGEWLGLIDRLEGRPGARRSLYLYLRHFLGWAAEREYIDANPLAGVRPPKPVAARDRVLSDEELRALWAVEGDMAELARLSVLTAQRLGSLTQMRWDQVDLARGIWFVPGEAMKSGQAHEVPLGAMAVEILRRRPRLAGPYIFGSGSNGVRPFNGVSKGMRIVRRSLAGVPNRKGQRVSDEAKAADREAIEKAERWRFHDLRRTAVTLAQRAGAPIDAIRALTQHKAPGVIGIYARHSYAEEKRVVVSGIDQIVGSVVRPPAADCAIVPGPWKSIMRTA